MVEIDAKESLIVRSALQDWHEDLTVLLQNVPLSETNFLRFAKARGIEVWGIINGDPGQFHERGWLHEDAKAPDDSPMFHPFRIYPLEQVLDACRLAIAPSASINRDHFLDFLTRIVQDGLPSFDRLNQIAATANAIIDAAVLLEPVYWPRITERRVFRGFISEGEHLDRAEEYRAKCLDLVGRLDPTVWQELHERLRHHAALLDENHDLYLLLRVAPWQRRETVKGRISGALWVRHTAEVVRLAFEEVHGLQWSSEEMGFGTWPTSARVRKYGTERPLDDPEKSKPYLAFEFGLHTGSVTRWYVEGETEFGAVSEMLPAAATGGIELVNMRGSLETKPSVAMKLSDSLEQDMAARRFSIISFDMDEPNAVRTIRQQVRQGKVVGFVSAHDPDFELANFSIDELVEVAARRDEESGLSADALRNRDWSSVKSAADFDREYRALSTTRASLKGAAWGRDLARYALDRPTLEGEVRPMLRDVEMALRSLMVHYDLQSSRYKIDPDTFELVEVADPDGAWS